MRLREDEATDRLNVLVAYPYFKGGLATVVGEHRSKIRLLVDSGAFTAFQAGNTILLDDYCRFLETLPVRPWGYFVLDVIGQPVATMKNYQEMLRRGFDPLPIFTRGTDPAVLDEYFKTSDVVGIGGLVGTPKNRGYVNGIMNHTAGRKVHLLGFTSLPYLKQYRPFSCDGSGWDNAGFGNLQLYMGHGQFIYVKRGMCSRPLPMAIQQRLAHYGVDPVILSKEVGWRGDTARGENRRDGARDKVATRCMVDYAFDLEARLGTKFFFSTATKTAMSNLAEALEWRVRR